MSGVFVLQVALWVVVAAMAVWILGPVVGYFWKGVQLGVEVYAEPPLARPYPEDLDGLRRYQEFVDLGYRPVGSTYEAARFFSPIHWRWRSRGVRWLAAPDQRTFVHLHRLVDDEPVRIGAVTVFEGGGTWHTACPGIASGAPRIEGHGREDIRGIGPTELLARHAAHVEAFARENGLTAKPTDLSELAAANLAYERLMLPKMGQASLAILPLGTFGLPLLFGLQTYARGGRAQISGLLTIVFMGLFYGAIRYGALHLTRAHTARRNHAVEQPSVAADGSIVAGRFERWVRALAMLAAVDIVARLGLVAVKGFERPLRGGGGLLFVALAVFFGVTSLREFIARGRGRAVTSRINTWSNWAFVAVWFDIIARPSQLQLAWSVGEFALAGLGWLLERRGRK